MTRNSIMRSLLLLSFIAILVQSCESPPCSDSDGVQLNAGFYSVKGFSVSDTSLTQLVSYALQNDEKTKLEYVLSQNRQTIYLPLSKNNDTSVFVFQFDSVRVDTLSFYHTKSLKLESHECGFDFFYEIIGAQTTNHVIDSVWVRLKNTGYGEQENVRIFF